MSKYHCLKRYSFPKFTMQTSEQVAAELVNALQKRKNQKLFPEALTVL